MEDMKNVMTGTMIILIVVFPTALMPSVMMGMFGLDSKNVTMVIFSTLMNAFKIVTMPPATMAM